MPSHGPISLDILNTALRALGRERVLSIEVAHTHRLIGENEVNVATIIAKGFNGDLNCVLKRIHPSHQSKLRLEEFRKECHLLRACESLALPAPQVIYACDEYVLMDFVEGSRLVEKRLCGVSHPGFAPFAPVAPDDGADPLPFTSTKFAGSRSGSRWDWVRRSCELFGQQLFPWFQDIQLSS